MPVSPAQTTPAATADARRLLATIGTEVFAPVPVIAAVAVVVGWHAASLRVSGLAFGVGLAVFASLIPFVIITRSVRRGTVTDHHIARRDQRRNPLVLACLSTIVGIGVIWVLGAPRELLAAGVAILAAELVPTVVNAAWWKMSIHTSVAAGCTAILTIAFGPWLVLAAAAVALNGWSRVHMRAHTVSQVLAGTASGAVVSAVLFALMR